MNERIVQRRGFVRIEAELLPTGVRYSERDFLRTHETIVPYEEIPEQVLRFWNPSRLYLLICAFFAALVVLEMYQFWSAGGGSGRSLAFTSLGLATASFGTWMRSPKYIGFHTRGNGVLFFDRRSNGSPEEFMKTLQATRVLTSPPKSTTPQN